MYKCMHTHTHSCTRTHARTHTHTHTCTRTRAHTHTHTYTNTYQQQQKIGTLCTYTPSLAIYIPLLLIPSKPKLTRIMLYRPDQSIKLWLNQINRYTHRPHPLFESYHPQQKCWCPHTHTVKDYYNFNWKLIEQSVETPWGFTCWNKPNVQVCSVPEQSVSFIAWQSPTWSCCGPIQGQCYPHQELDSKLSALEIAWKSGKANVQLRQGLIVRLLRTVESECAVKARPKCCHEIA